MNVNMAFGGEETETVVISKGNSLKIVLYFNIFILNYFR
jgi:hypothetical protein